MINCDDCGDPMQEARLCLVMFSPLNEEIHDETSTAFRTSAATVAG